MVGVTLRGAGVAVEEPEVEVRLNVSNARYIASRRFDRGGLMGPFDLTVEKRDVILDHHMHVGEIESLLDWPKRRADAIGKRQVVDVRVGSPA